MGIKLVHESLQPATEPEIFDVALDLLKLMREQKVIGIAVCYFVDREEEPREHIQIINDECGPENILQSIIDLGNEIINEYDVEDFMPEGIG
jgi:hypothetical protein